ncbi:hypothetical protein DASC09_011460 [Saccharomycopsis crataegensis]|uniref:Uncharacterized protein n=1 Tax=Saccharomycopsis crataegensis TaxID=43959 RepID=A0AAV5QGM8_9ASCO|nr:hypothetical protein DASC09_011460 [Saccharomycopsis crataegensis]
MLFFENHSINSHSFTPESEPYLPSYPEAARTSPPRYSRAILPQEDSVCLLPPAYARITSHDAQYKDGDDELPHRNTAAWALICGLVILITLGVIFATISFLIGRQETVPDSIGAVYYILMGTAFSILLFVTVAMV